MIPPDWVSRVADMTSISYDPARRNGVRGHDGAGDGTRTRGYQLGKLIPYPTFRDLNYPSDLAVLETNTIILANVLDEILEK